MVIGFVDVLKSTARFDGDEVATTATTRSENIGVVDDDEVRRW